MSKAQREKGAAGGLCGCGCGLTAPLAPHTDTRRGWTRGEPLRFIHGHNGRIALDDLIEEQACGYATPCWVWLGGKTGNGYGRAKHDGEMQPAHRVFFLRSGGTIPAGWQLDHLCRNRLCVNPQHLEPVTPAENTRRSSVTKLTPCDVAAIRAARDAALAATPLTLEGTPRKRVKGGNALRERLALQYGVRADYIKAIWRGDTWA